MSLKDRLKEFLKYKDISQGKFEKLADLSNGFVNNAKEGFHTKSLDKIKKAFPELNTAWLLTGEGEMLIKKVYKENDQLTLTSENMIPVEGMPKDAVDYKEKYIKQLEKENDRLNNSLESVETNLALVRKYSEVLVAWVEAFASSAPAHLSKSSEEAASWLQDIHKRLVDNLPPHAKGDISVGSLSRDKKLS